MNWLIEPNQLKKKLTLNVVMNTELEIEPYMLRLQPSKLKRI